MKDKISQFSNIIEELCAPRNENEESACNMIAKMNSKTQQSAEEKDKATIIN